MRSQFYAQLNADARREGFGFDATWAEAASDSAASSSVATGLESSSAKNTFEILAGFGVDELAGLLLGLKALLSASFAPSTCSA